MALPMPLRRTTRSTAPAAPRPSGAPAGRPVALTTAGPRALGRHAEPAGRSASSVLRRPVAGWRGDPAPARGRSLYLDGPRLGGSAAEGVRIEVSPPDRHGQRAYQIAITASHDTRARCLLELALERLERGSLTADREPLAGGAGRPALRALPTSQPDAAEIAEAMAEAPAEA